MKVGKVTLLRSAPGRSWEIMCMRTAEQWSACTGRLLHEDSILHTIPLLAIHHSLIFGSVVGRLVHRASLLYVKQEMLAHERPLHPIQRSVSYRQ